MTTDIQLNGQSLTAASTAGQSAPAAATPETWPVVTLAAGIPTLDPGKSYALKDASATATQAQKDEVIRVSSLTAGATSITVIRGDDGTTPVAHAASTQYNIVAVPAYLNRMHSRAPAYAPEALQSAYDDARGLQNLKAANTRRLDQGRADAGVGGAGAGGQSTHLFVGDSLGAGATSLNTPVTYDRLHAMPLMMRDNLAINGIPANGTGLIRVNDNGQADARWLVVAPTATIAANVTYSTFTGAGGTLTCVVDRAGSVLDIFYRDDGAATVTFAVDGATTGPNFATLTTGSTAVWKKFRMYGVAVRPNSQIKMTITTAGTGFSMAGLSVWSPGAGLIMHNAAQSGSYACTGLVSGLNRWDDLTNVNSPSSIFKDIVAGRQRTITDASVTAGSNVLTSTAAGFTTNDQGDPIDQYPQSASVGALFPPNTYMQQRLTATTMQMSANALITASAQTLGLGRDPNCVHVELGGNDVIDGTTSMTTLKTGLTTIINMYPKSDIVLHLVGEAEPSYATAAEEAAFQLAMYQLADALDIVLYDWRDRIGPYATAKQNGVMQDFVGHMIPGMGVDLGSTLAASLAGGTANPQYHYPPVRGADLGNKDYIDGASFTTAATSSPVLTTTDTFVVGRPIPANWMKVGASYRVTIIAQLSAVGNPSFRLRLGPLGTVADAALITHTPALAAAGYVQVDMLFTPTALGAAGTSKVAASNDTRGLAPTATNSIVTTATPAINTTVANVLSVSASATAGNLTMHSVLIRQE